MEARKVVRRGSSQSTLQVYSTPWFSTFKMGGGNAQKSATARARNLEKASAQKVRTVQLSFLHSINSSLTSQNAGGGAKGKEARTGGNMAEAMAAAQGKFASPFHAVGGVTYLTLVLIVFSQA